MIGSPPPTTDRPAQQSPPGVTPRLSIALWTASIVTGWVIYVSLGLFAALGLARLLVANLLRLDPVPEALLVPLALGVGLVAGALAGGICGLAQGWVLRRALGSAARWVYATAAGWALGWGAVWLGAQLAGLGSVQAGAVGPGGTGAMAGATSWATISLFVGLAQWFAIRGRVQQASWWVPFTAVSWLAGAMACWLMGAFLEAGITMYWSASDLLEHWRLFLPGLISSATGWIVVGAVSGLGARNLLR